MRVVERLIPHRVLRDLIDPGAIIDRTIGALRDQLGDPEAVVILADDPDRCGLRVRAASGGMPNLPATSPVAKTVNEALHALLRWWGAGGVPRGAVIQRVILEGPGGQGFADAGFNQLQPRIDEYGPHSLTGYRRIRQASWPAPIVSTFEAMLEGCRLDEHAEVFLDFARRRDRQGFRDLALALGMRPSDIETLWVLAKLGLDRPAENS